MALGYNIIARGAIGDLWFKVVDLTLDSAYAAGGYTLSPGSLGLGANGVVLGVIPMSNPGFITDFNQATGKLRIRDASGGVGAATPEAANNLAALNGLVVRCLVLGRGSPG
jgi:hypothetical protein